MRRWLWRGIAASVVDPVALPDINAARAAAQLAPALSLFALMHEGPDLSLTLFPAWFGAPQPDWPAPLVCGDFAWFDPDPAAQFPAEAEDFLAAGPAPIVFTHGTGNRQAHAFFGHALAAVTRLGRRAIFLTPHREQVGASLPVHALWQPYLPLRRLLPRAALLVHHGGIGTTAEALRADLAQLVVPLAFDQFDNGARVGALGAGEMLRHDRLNTATLVAALSRLLAVPPGRAVIAESADAWTGLIDAIEAQTRAFP